MTRREIAEALTDISRRGRTGAQLTRAGMFVQMQIMGEAADRLRTGLGLPEIPADSQPVSITG